jgi:hypothetical protein
VQAAQELVYQLVAMHLATQRKQAKQQTWHQMTIRQLTCYREKQMTMHQRRARREVQEERRSASQGCNHPQAQVEPEQAEVGQKAPAEPVG